LRSITFSCTPNMLSAFSNANRFARVAAAASWRVASLKRSLKAAAMGHQGVA
jgi:hypothetical protein